MPENIADNFDGASCFDLSCRVGVAENVRTQEIGMDAGSLRVHCEPSCESTGSTQPRVWQSMTNENSPIACMRGAVILGSPDIFVEA